MSRLRRLKVGGWSRASCLFRILYAVVPRLLLKTFMISVRALAILILLFMPSILALMGIAFLTGSTRWFGYLGLPILLINGAVVFAKPQRDRVWRWLTSSTTKTPNLH